MAEKKVVLIVDDTPENIDLLRGLLSDSYKVKAAVNGQMALKIAALPEKPHLILLDVIMPGMDGYTVCSQLKANKETKQIPIVFITANAEKEDIQKALDAGGVDCLAKPIDPAALNRTIQKFIL